MKKKERFQMRIKLSNNQIVTIIMYAENDSKEALEEMSETARSMIGNIEILSIEKSIEIEKKT